MQYNFTVAALIYGHEVYVFNERTINKREN
jgi:hypothetical protein